MYEETFINGTLMFRLQSNMTWKVVDTTIGNAVNAVYKLEPEERLEVFAKFCVGCGTACLPCPCQRDE